MPPEMTDQGKSEGGARALAFEILGRVEEKGAYASILLQRMDPAVEEREAGLVTELVYGCLRNRYGDERLLETLAGRPLAGIDASLARLFRIAAHQILRLDRIPERAAVHEAVEGAKRLGGRIGTGGAKFLNAVLRKLCREKGSLPRIEIPSWTADPEGHAAALSLVHSHPLWLVKRWLARFGPEGASALLRAGNLPAASALLVNPAGASREEAASLLASEEIETEASPRHPGFLRVVRGSVRRSAAFARGLVYIQDEASGLVPLLVSPAPGARVLDACAAPGGKSIGLAGAVREGGLVVAADKHVARLALIRSNLGRMRIGNVRLLACDAASPPFGGAFDAVLVDAPCSGTGVLRRDVETRYRLEEAHLADLARGQDAILDGAASCVKRGGRLVYAVCSIEPEEGEERVAAFLERHAGFRLEDLRAAIPASPELVTPDGFFRTYPHLHGMDGFFAAALTRS